MINHMIKKQKHHVTHVIFWKGTNAYSIVYIFKAFVFNVCVLLLWLSQIEFISVTYVDIKCSQNSNL